MDGHVDDLLKRQMSLRGQPGVSRDHGRRWFYQNWFVFMIVGMVGAVTGWAIIEPFLDDHYYVQGQIGQWDPADTLERSMANSAQTNRTVLARGSLTLNGEKIYLLHGIREITPNGQVRKFDVSTLAPAQRVGLYVNYEPRPESDLAVATFLVRAPGPATPKAALSLSQLHTRSRAAGFILFAVVAALTGLFIGAADGLICRLPQRAFICGAVGLAVGSLGGIISTLMAAIVYAGLNTLAMQQMDSSEGSLKTLGFTIQLAGRSLAWGFAGLAMGLGQGIAMRSSRLLVYGLTGGVIGGLLGGLLFDPIDLILLGGDKPSSHWSRLIGLAVIGSSVGAMIGLVELLAREAWLRMTEGPLAGKEFLIFKNVINIGASPKSDIYLFKDPMVADHHAVIRAIGDGCEIEARQPHHPILINDRSVPRTRLRHGDTVTIGRTTFVFQQRKA